MPQSGPTVRASHLKEDLEALSILGPEVEAGVRARLTPALLAQLTESTKTNWLPISINIEMAEAVHALAGAQGARAWGRETFLVSLESFFKPLLQAITALFDPSPAAISRFAPRAWKATYRDCGELVVENLAPDQLRVSLSGFPEPMLRAGFRAALAGTFESTYVFCNFDGTVELEPDVPGKDPSYLVAWRRREKR
jgi:hypothetical protein